MTTIADLPKTYKAASISAANGPWEIVTKEIRAPAPNEVLIRVHASGICNSDHFAKSGMWPGIQFPRVTGHEVVGRVAGVGAGVSRGDREGRYKLGALVGVGWNGGYCGRCEACRAGNAWVCKEGQVTGFTYDGGHAEYMYAPETAIVSIPEEALQNASYAELAPLLCGGITVFDAIRTAPWKPGDLCLVQGIGGLGHLAIQYASKLGLKVVAISSGSSKRSLALSLGASDYVDASTTDVVAYAKSRGGARLVLCTAPYSQSISDIIPAVGLNGTVTLVSAAVDGKIQVENLVLNMNRAALRGWCCGCAPDMEQCVKFSTLSDVKSMVQTFPLEEYPSAYDGVQANKARFRNVIVFP
ncbi:chaperonin 10-like protein [Rhodofomes roseus]|uniref:Chaperonin 10-like protein n=1 Tax=Rhodofomes roseus TaxID=34475 RepID=A0ABQ8K7G9_9APHY|nr:chaperonin 10-like protein [Rhodofomes roseus]KAH9832874.1 chaperonin 10-like protein [Rhodofomes roseus]